MSYSLYSLGVLDTDVSTGPGQHFIVLSKKGKLVEYFDPLGQPWKKYKNLENLLRKRRVKYHTHVQVQDYFSTFCGFFCALFVILEENPILNYTMTPFSKVLHKNDTIVIDNLVQCFKSSK